MDLKEFHVEMVARQRAIYRVRAPDGDGARRQAAERWQRSEPSDLEGFDGSELESMFARETPDDTAREQDAEVLLRFIRERENLLLKLGGLLPSATANDAISAVQAATDLGWFTPDSPYGQHAVDTFRATLALERLCDMRALICFERPRFRGGERGDIRLYCTPTYLEQLSEELHGTPERVR